MNSLKKRYLELIELTQEWIQTQPEEPRNLIVDAHLKSYFKPSTVCESLNPYSKKTLKDSTPTSQLPPALTTSFTPMPPPPSFSPQPPQATERPPQSFAEVSSIKAPAEPLILSQNSKASLIPLASNEVKKESVVQEPSFLFKPEATQTPAPVLNKQEFISFFKTFFPQIHLRDQPPCDLQAKEIKNRWKDDEEAYPVMILTDAQDPMKIQFLQNIVRAITLRFTHAKLIFLNKIQPQKWDDLLSSPSVKLIMACKEHLKSQAELSQAYHEDKEKDKEYLHKTPLITLKDLSWYFKDPKLKSALWRQICQEFAVLENIKN